jgi:CheY-like chemotaxis protein
VSDIKGEAQILDTAKGEGLSLVDRVVLRLNAIGKRVTFDLALSVGKVIVDSFYGGDLGVWRHRGTKEVSFRKLAKHPELSMSPSVLYRSVAIYELACRLGISPRGRLSTTHLRLALPLAEDDQERLLRSAELGTWSVSRLREEIESTLSPSAIRGGRKRQAPFRRTLRALDRYLTESAGRAVVVSEEISPESVTEVSSALRRIQDTCAALERQFTTKARIDRGDHAGSVSEVMENPTHGVVAPQRASQEVSDFEPDPTGGKIFDNILVVEDEAAFARALFRIASDYGHPIHVGTVGDARKVLADMTRSWKAFIVDLFLPDGHGLKILEHIRGRFPTTPALVITGHLDGDAVNSSYDLGAGFLLKPFEPTRIRRFLESTGSVRSQRSLPRGMSAGLRSKVA